MKPFFSKRLFLVIAFALMLSISRDNAAEENKIPHQPKYITHQVSSGENLYFLSAYYYGDARQWERILNENRKTIKNPNKLEIGTELKIAVEPDWTPKYSVEEFRKMTEKGE